MTSVDPTDRPLPLGKLLVGLSVLAVCCLYALTTVLYVLPNNPLRIQFDAELLAFEKYAYQKWTFFAPPPRGSDRLYFAFSPKSGEGVTVEVLEGIYARKRQDNPHNIKTQVVDYAVSGTASQISDAIREIYRYRRVHELLGGDLAYLDDLAKTMLRPDDRRGASVRILLRYAAMIAAEQGIDPDGLKCQIAFTSLPLRPFTQRYNTEFRVEEQLTYKTAVLDVPQLVNR